MILNQIIQHVHRKYSREFKAFDADRFTLSRKRPIHDPIPALNNHFFLITEIKRASPSAGIIQNDIDPVQIAQSYWNAGASAISVLTESAHFNGSEADLQAVGNQIHLPLLRKDFIIHPFQIYESYNLGADMILLIAACLSGSQLECLYQTIRRLGMQAIIEVHTREELESVLALDPDLIGINNRDLKSFRTDLSVSKELIRDIPKRIYAISESGIRSAKQVTMLKDLGFAGALVGESLMRSRNRAQAVREMIDA